MKKLILLFLFISFQFTEAQTPQKLNSSEIFENIKKLNFLGSVLYLDDEYEIRRCGIIFEELTRRDVCLVIVIWG